MYCVEQYKSKLISPKWSELSVVPAFQFSHQVISEASLPLKEHPTEKLNGVRSDHIPGIYIYSTYVPYLFILVCSILTALSSHKAVSHSEQKQRRSRCQLLEQPGDQLWH